MNFRLATLTDNTPYVRNEVMDMAQEYCRRSKDPCYTAEDIYEIFQGFSANNISAPQILLGWDGPKPVSFIVTEAIEYGKKVGINMNAGYLRAAYKDTGFSFVCLEALEDLAKTSGYAFIMCQTQRNPKAYTRWISKGGYRPVATVFYKEI